MNRFFIYGELQDYEIKEALVQCAVDYENGEILEVKGVLIEIINAISAFERQEGTDDATNDTDNNCRWCKYRRICELADQVNFCEDCKYYPCGINGAECKAGYEIECNNTFEPNDDYCDDDEEEDDI